MALALRARAILLIFEKFTRAYLFQIALEIMWLPILIIHMKKFLHSDWLRAVQFFLSSAEKS